MSNDSTHLFQESSHKSAPLVPAPPVVIQPRARQPFANLPVNVLNNSPHGMSPVRIPARRGPLPVQLSPQFIRSPQNSPRVHQMADHGQANNLPQLSIPPQHPASPNQERPQNPGWPSQNGQWMQAPQPAPSSPRHPPTTPQISASEFIHSLSRNRGAQQILFQQHPDFIKQLNLVRLIQQNAVKQQAQPTVIQRPPTPNSFMPPLNQWEPAAPSSPQLMKNPPKATVQPNRNPEASVLESCANPETATNKELIEMVDLLKNAVINRDEDIAKYRSDAIAQDINIANLESQLEAKSRVLETNQSKCGVMERQLRETEEQLRALEGEHRALRQEMDDAFGPFGQFSRTMRSNSDGSLRSSPSSRSRLSPSRKLNVDYKHQMQLAEIRVKRLRDELNCSKNQIDQLNQEIEMLRVENDNRVETEREMIRWKQVAEEYHDRMKDACEAKAFSDVKSEDVTAELGMTKTRCKEQQKRIADLERELVLVKGNAKVENSSVEEMSSLCQRVADLERQNGQLTLKALEVEYKHENYKQRYHESASRCNMLEQLIDTAINVPESLTADPQVVQGLCSWYEELQQAQVDLEAMYTAFGNEFDRRLKQELAVHMADARAEVESARNAHEKREAELCIESIMEGLIWKVVCSELEGEYSARVAKPTTPPKETIGLQRMVDIQRHEIEKWQRELKQLHDRHARLKEQYNNVAMIQDHEYRMSEQQVHAASEMEIEIRRKNEQIAAYESRIAELENRISKLPTVENEEKLKRQISKMSSKLRNLELVESDLRRKLQESEANVSRVTSEMNRFRAESRRKLSSNMTKMENLRSQLENVREQNSRVTHAKQACDLEVQRLAQEVQVKTDTERSLQEKIAEMQRESTTQHNRYLDLTEQNARLSGIVSQQEGLTKAVSLKLEELKTRYLSLQAERDELQSRVTCQEKNGSHGLQAKYERLKAILEELTRTKEAYEQENRDLKEQVEKHRSDKRELREIAKDIRNEGQTKLTNMANKLKFMSSLAIASYKVLRSEQEFIQSNPALLRHWQHLCSELNQQEGR